MPKRLFTVAKSTPEYQSKRVKELMFLTRSSHALNATLDLDHVLRLIMRIVRRGLNVETVSVLFFDDKRQNMVFRLAHGKQRKELLGLKIPIGRGIAGWVAKHGRPVVSNDLSRDWRNAVNLDKKLGLRTRSIMSIPLRRRNKMIGVLEAVNQVRNEPFTKEDLAFFMALGDHIATAIDNARLYEAAERSRLENSLLYQTSLALGRVLTLDEVLEQILENLKKLIPYDAAAIFVLDPKDRELKSYLQHGYPPEEESRLRLKLDEGVVGWAATHKTGMIVPDVTQDPRYINANPNSRSEMVTPMLSRGKVIGLFNLESDQVNAYRERDLLLLDSFAAMAGVTIERARLYEEQRVKQEIEGELKIARTVQQFFTPRKSRKLGKYTLTGRNYPSLELSGDYLDVFALRKPHMAFAIADVAGKGVPASIIMSSFRATLRTAAPYFTHAREIAERANQILLETVRPEDFVTAFIGVLDTESGEATYCNAGHNPAILMKPDGKYELLETGGTVLGILKDNKLQEGRFAMEDSVLFAYTDGTVDVTDPDGQPFGFERLLGFLKEHRDLSTVQFSIELRKHLVEFMHGTPQSDDVTFLLLKK
jgi:sigma-B regulation protein RsbU (phosphoserine phosphatase)